MSEDAALEVHAVQTGDEFDAGPEMSLLRSLQDAIDLASDQDRMTWLTDRGKRIAAVVPVEQAERGQITAEQQATLAARVDAVLALVRPKVQPRGFEITNERWLVHLKAQIAQVFLLGIGVGWEKCAAAHAARSPEA